MLVELLLFEHADFVFGCVHSPIFDKDIEFRQVEIRSHGVAAENAIALVVAVGDVMRAEPVGEHSLAVRLDEGPAFAVMVLLSSTLVSKFRRSRETLSKQASQKVRWKAC